VEAMTMADRVLIMNQGKNAQMGKPLDVFRKPANLFVAGFIGTPPMNFCPCTLKSSGGKTMLGDGYFNVTLDAARAKVISEKAPNSELILGVRPQHLNISTSKLDGDSFMAEIFAVEPLGTETIVDIKLGDDIFKAVASASYSANIRDKIWVKIDPDGMQIFDKKTELAIA
jgi:multiple sugar transport system ATP-binding protein